MQGVSILEFKEKKLYHQIHPVKLLVDWCTGIIALYFIWLHEIVVALLIMLIPAMIASFVIIQFVNLDKYKQSPFGIYMLHHMTKRWEAVRLIGFIIAILAAWFHVLWLIFVGILIILFGWVYGLFFP